MVDPKYQYFLIMEKYTSEFVVSEIEHFLVNSHTPVAQKFAKEVVFRRFQGEGVEFFSKRSFLTPLLRFLMRIFRKIPI